MKKFILRIFLFGFIFFIVDKSFLLVRNTIPDRDFDNRLERILEGDLNNKDIIILGSSRGESNILANEIENYFNLKAFNLSYGGSSISFQKFVLEKYLKYNTKPKLIIKVIDDDFEFKTHDLIGQDRGYRFDRLYPITKYEDIREKLIELGDKNLILSNLFIIHQLNLSAFNFKVKGVKKGVLEYGALNLNSHTKIKESYNSQDMSFNTNDNAKKEIEAFKSIQNICSANEIQIIYAVSPVYRKMNQEWLDDTRKIINDDKNIFVFDTINEFYKQKEVYGDKSHLNLVGATQFTNDIMIFIEQNNILKDL